MTPAQPGTPFGGPFLTDRAPVDTAGPCSHCGAILRHVLTFVVGPSGAAAYPLEELRAPVCPRCDAPDGNPPVTIDDLGRLS